MANMFDFIKRLNPSKEQWRIKVRVIRLRKQKNFWQPKLGDNIEMLLLAEHVMVGKLQQSISFLAFDDECVKGIYIVLSNDMSKGYFSQRLNFYI
ncbi:hypothetical protein SLEP1_g44395 [Rubroshorea leprosula]|uniref:Uncharacterized protein n=1 Tax=Rubroshorea leprosula TaxID=152421 RepID=A0AAV5LHD9_9ROSI|nr:hypothetical protein SLEP1_g44395 [Rubroshorea leprosula]